MSRMNNLVSVQKPILASNINKIQTFDSLVNNLCYLVEQAEEHCETNDTQIKYRSRLPPNLMPKNKLAEDKSLENILEHYNYLTRISDLFNSNYDGKEKIINMFEQIYQIIIDVSMAQFINEVIKQISSENSNNYYQLLMKVKGVDRTGKYFIDEHGELVDIDYDIYNDIIRAAAYVTILHKQDKLKFWLDYMTIKAKNIHVKNKHIYNADIIKAKKFHVGKYNKSNEIHFVKSFGMFWNLPGSVSIERLTKCAERFGKEALAIIH